MIDQQGTKRSAGKGDNENGGRRKMPYAPRACDACRKRKGKCCGRCPCEYCISRNQHCKYSLTTAEWRIAMPTTVAGLGQTDLPQFQAPQSSTSGVGYTNQPHAETRPNQAGGNAATSNQSLAALTELVADLHGQVNMLAAQLRQNNADNAASGTLASLSGTNQTVSNQEIGTRPVASCPGSPRGDHMNNQNDTAPSANDSTASQAQSQFCGPTSPDYSLNVAQINLGQKHLTMSSDERTDPANVFKNNSDDGDLGSTYGEDITVRSQQHAASSSTEQRLLLFRSILDMHEAIRLLNVYQEVVGEYHPIVNTKTMITHLTWCYKRQNVPPHLPPSVIDENSLLMINLAIAIALCAESTLPGSKSFETGKALYLSCKELINAKLVSPMPSIKHVVIIILVGFLHFYKDMLRYAWRMCGLAGRTLMELGLHNGEVSRSVITSDAESLEYANIISSIIVLDRQWSAATGLPSHFKNFDFDIDLKQLLKNPYLKAMILFTSMSDKFSEPILRVAKGETYEDDNEFDIMNFQIEQWRKKAIGNYDQKDTFTDPTKPDTISPWALLLKLRANAVHSLLLRPFFLTYKPGAPGCRSIRRGLDLVTDTVDTLTSLNKNTDIYWKQHPPFQHVLATACALLFLIIAYVDQSRGNMSADVPKDYSELVARNFKQAYYLASTYSKSSRASRRLWKRLIQMKRLLIDNGVPCGGDVMRSNDLAPVVDDVSQPTMTQPSVINVSSDDLSKSLGEPAYLPERRMWDSHPTPGLLNDVYDNIAFSDLDCDLPFSAIPVSPPGIASRIGAEGRNMDHLGVFEDEWPLFGSNGLFYSA